jgi:CHAT domain-containing protein
MSAYLSGDCAPKLRAEVETHCLACAECRARLALLLCVCRSEVSAEEQRELEPLLALGEQAANKARQQILTQYTETIEEELPPEDANHGPTPPRAAVPVTKRRPHWPFLRLAVAAVVVIGLGVIGYWAWRPASPVEPGLRALRLAYQGSRPLEARLTGGFAHQPYERQRGSAGAAGIDHDQLNYAHAELSRAVASQPSPETRQALGKLHLLRGEFDEADKQFSLAVKEAPRNARLQADLAALYYERSKHEDPFPLLAKALEHSTMAIELDAKLAEAWFNRALCHEAMALFTDAQADLERFLELDANSPWAEEARERLKKLRARPNNSAERERGAQTEFLAAEAAGDTEILRRLANDHFPALQKLGTERLLDEYLEAASAGEMARAEERLRTLRQLAQLLSEIKGDRFLADAVGFAARADPTTRQALISVRQLVRRADQEVASGSFDAALALSTQAHRQALHLRDPCSLELATFGLARFHTLRHPSADHLALKEQLAADTASRSHLQLHARALLALANTYATDYQLSRSLELDLKAAEIARKLGDIETLTNASRLAGANYARMGDYESAVRKNHEAVALLRQHPVSATRAFQAYHQLSNTLLILGNYPAALPYQREVVRLSEQGGNQGLLASDLGKLGLIYGKLGRYEEATRYLDDALARVEAIQDQTMGVMLKVDIYAAAGDFYQHQGQLEQAIAAYQRAAEVIGETNNRGFLPVIRQGLAAAYLAQGREAEAEAELRASIELAERDRGQINDAPGRSAFLASRQNIYQAMVDFQFTRQRDPAPAFNYAEIAKSRELLDLLRGQHELKWRDGRLRLALSDSASPLTLEETQRALPDQVQLAAYAVTEQRLLIWLITRQAVFRASAPVSADRLRLLVADYLAALRARRAVEALDQQAAELYELLIAPIAARLDPRRALCIIPDGALHQLPFAALIAPATRRYLLEDFALTINPSASVLAHALELSRSKKSRAPETFLGLSNPRFNQRRLMGLPALPAAEQEVARAQALYPQSRVLSREQATESALVRQMGHYETLHLATHTLIDASSPLLSAIVLADEGDPVAEAEPGRAAFDGRLHAYEILQQKLPHTRLVVLSSCRSGLSAQARAEALSGLAQAFFAAGVPSIIASLWDVDDQSTAEIMEAFHHQRRVKQQSAAAALREAQLAARQHPEPKRRHPYYWAAFLATGDGLSD